jgi:hypothetical protein
MPTSKRSSSQNLSRSQTKKIVVDAHRLDKHLIGSQDSPFGTLHDDSEIYNSRLYAATRSGLLHVEAHRPRSEKPVRVRPKKLWDGQALSLKAGRRTLAVAAGGDGLFEAPLEYDNVIQLSKRHTQFVNWTFASIYASSDLSHGYMAAFGWHEHTDTDGMRGRWERQYLREIEAESIFNDSGLSWGCQEKLYMVKQGTLKAVKFRQKSLSEDDPLDKPPFANLGQLSAGTASDSAISGGVSTFGTVVEYENALLVIRSDETIFSIPGPVTRWRVFPRSERYENQLHVISEDRLDIYSFNHDYFVDQQNKISGTIYETKQG